MIQSMYSVIDKVCQVTDEMTGVKVSIPKPSQRALRTSSVTNAVAGASLVLFGLISPYKWTVLAGGMGIASSIIMRAEVKKMN